TTYGEFKTVRDDLHRLWKVKSCVDTAARFNERTEEQKLQNRPQTRQKKEELSR
ncbi:mobilization protein, partial [Blautia sp. OF09-25XD]